MRGLRLGLGLTRGGAAGLPQVALLYDMNFAAGDALDPDFTHTRATSAWRRKSDGLWEEVGSGVLRFHHDAAGNPLGILVEEQRTSRALHNRDLTQTEWVKSASMAAAKDATGIDGVANSASTLTSSAATQTALQSITLTSAAYVFQPWIKRKTGTGTIEITIDGGATWVDVTATVDADATVFHQVETTQTLANPEVGFRLGTSGDEIEVDFAELQDSTFLTSPIETAGSAVTRVADSIEGGEWPENFTVRADGVMPDVIAGLARAVVGQTGSATISDQPMRARSDETIDIDLSPLTAISGTSAAVGSSFKAATRRDVNGIAAVVNGGAIGKDVGEPLSIKGNTISIGSRGSGSRNFVSTISRFKLWRGALSDADLQAETS